MTALILDAGALYAQADADEPQHDTVAEIRAVTPLQGGRSSCCRLTPETKGT
jgi:hypothetical protein